MGVKAPESPKAEEVKKEIPGVVQQEVSKQLSKQKVSVEVDK